MHTLPKSLLLTVMLAPVLLAQTSPPDGTLVESHESQASSSYVGQSSSIHYTQAQQFYVDGQGQAALSGIGLLLRDTDLGNPTDPLTLALYTNGSGNLPDQMVAGSEQTITPALGQWNYIHYTGISITRGQENKYWIVATLPDQSDNNAYCWCRSGSNTYDRGYHKQLRSDTGSWQTASNDLSFRVYEDQTLSVSRFQASISVEQVTVRINWSTGAELGTLGFRIFRSQAADGSYDCISPQLISAKGHSTQGARYNFTDSSIDQPGNYFYKIIEVHDSGETVVAGPLQIKVAATAGQAHGFTLKGAYPNPFNPSTALAFTAPPGFCGKSVDIQIYNIRGQSICRLQQSVLRPGLQECYWDGCDHLGLPVAGGLYLCRFVCNNRFLGAVKIMKSN